MTDGSSPHGGRRAMVATMLLGEFLLLTWLGVTIIGDTAGRSLVIAAVLTALTVVGLRLDQRRRG